MMHGPINIRQKLLLRVTDLILVHILVLTSTGKSQDLQSAGIVYVNNYKELTLKRVNDILCGKALQTIIIVYEYMS